MDKVKIFIVLGEYGKPDRAFRSRTDANNYAFYSGLRGHHKKESNLEFDGVCEVELE